MRFFKYTLALCLMFITLSVSAKGDLKRQVYMFGFSASFNDSIIYFTPIQQLDAYIKSDRTHFLVNRDQYSYQLRNYFDNRGQLHRTCVTIFDTDKDKIEKKYAKMKEKYTTKSKNRFDVNYLSDSDFKFTTVSPDNGVVYVDPNKAEEAAAEDKSSSKKKHK